MNDLTVAFIVGILLVLGYLARALGVKGDIESLATAIGGWFAIIAILGAMIGGVLYISFVR